MKFNTPSGKIELSSYEARKLWGITPVPSYTTVTEESENGKYPLTFITPNAAGRIHSQFGNLDAIKTILDKPAVMMSPADARRQRNKQW